MNPLNAALAAILGVALAVGETVRRSGTASWWPFVVDDYLMAALLLAGAWRAHRSAYADLRVLLAAWAFCCGMLYLSFFSNLQRQLASAAETGISSPVWVVLIGVALATAIVGATLTLRAMRVDR
jgi:drug/metabolite transporter (DMT)-like permease